MISSDGPSAAPRPDRVRLESLRVLTIERLTRSWQASVPVVLAAEVDARALLARKAGLGGSDPPPSLTALVASVLARTMADHPEVNSTLDGAELCRHHRADLGIATATPDGNLVVPVVHGADRLSVVELAAAIADLRDRAARRRLLPAEVRGGTMTLSNIGMHVAGVVGMATIPLGHAGIVLVSGIYDTPAVVDGGVEVVPRLPLSLTVDHRVVNGVAMATFLRDLLARLETAEITPSPRATGTP
jgi:pyruvate/2-oxoglutarate dehydrogenase complex dihydrolipoamide acyltransferase (E2) component